MFSVDVSWKGVGFGLGDGRHGVETEIRLFTVLGTNEARGEPVGGKSTPNLPNPRSNLKFDILRSQARTELMANP